MKGTVAFLCFALIAVVAAHQRAPQKLNHEDDIIILQPDSGLNPGQNDDDLIILVPDGDLSPDQGNDDDLIILVPDDLNPGQGGDDDLIILVPDDLNPGQGGDDDLIILFPDLDLNPEPEVVAPEPEAPIVVPEPEVPAPEPESPIVVPEPDVDPEPETPGVVPEADIEFLENGCPVNPHIHWLLPSDEDCNWFYYCHNNELEPRACAPGLHFNSEIQACDWPSEAGCVTSFNKHLTGRQELRNRA